MGESVAEATVTNWLKKPGDTISEDEAVVEIATDKVDSEVPSPVSGTLREILVEKDNVALVGQALAIIEIEGDESPSNEAQAEVQHHEEELPTEIPGLTFTQHDTPRENAESSASSRFYSPLVKSIAAEEGISTAQLEQIVGTGAEGRVTKADILDFIKNNKVSTAGSVAAPTVKPAPAAPSYQEASVTIPQQTPPPVYVSEGDEIIEMDRMRRMIASHMVMSKQVSPHVTSFVEADVTNLVKWRERVKSAFEKREGQKITYTPIFVQAVARAIREMPLINVSVDGNNIIRHRNINIGMAAALPTGNLIVPVIKNADQLSLVGLTRSVNDLAGRARNNKLLPDEVKDGTFTLTNIGSFGNIMGVPIINQPQVAILAVGTIQKKPAVLETEYGDVIAIRHKMYLSMSYDHRVVDGALGGKFLRRVADILEAWDLNADF